jgi:hypothetical protein
MGILNVQACANVWPYRPHAPRDYYELTLLISYAASGEFCLH